VQKMLSNVGHGIGWLAACLKPTGCSLEVGSAPKHVSSSLIEAKGAFAVGDSFSVNFLALAVFFWEQGLRRKKAKDLRN